LKRGDYVLIRGDSGEKNNLGKEGVRASVRKIKNKKIKITNILIK
jgi:hypothetical protein